MLWMLNDSMHHIDVDGGWWKDQTESNMICPALFSVTDISDLDLIVTVRKSPISFSSSSNWLIPVWQNNVDGLTVLLKNQNPWSPYGPPKAGGWVAHPNPGWPVITNVEIQTKLKLSDIANCIPWNNPPPPPPPPPPPKKKRDNLFVFINSTT